MSSLTQNAHFPGDLGQIQCTESGELYKLASIEGVPRYLANLKPLAIYKLPLDLKLLSCLGAYLCGLIRLLCFGILKCKVCCLLSVCYCVES